MSVVRTTQPQSFLILHSLNTLWYLLPLLLSSFWPRAELIFCSSCNGVEPGAVCVCGRDTAPSDTISVSGLKERVWAWAV